MKKAFTLAEIIITIALIGVVAAITIRNIYVNTEKLITEVRLKKTFAELEYAFQQGVAKNGYVTQNTYGIVGSQGNIFKEYFEPYLRLERNCSEQAKSDQKKAWQENCGYKDSWLKRNGDRAGFMNTYYKNTRALIKLQNGAVVFFAPYTSNCTKNEDDECTDEGSSWVTRAIWVDIDGPKGKNKYGRDVFCFTINFETNKLAPQIYHGTDTYSDLKGKCKTHGLTCSALIMQNGWKIPNDYPWD